METKKKEVILTHLLKNTNHYYFTVQATLSLTLFFFWVERASIVFSPSCKATPFHSNVA